MRMSTSGEYFTCISLSSFLKLFPEEAGIDNFQIYPKRKPYGSPKTLLKM